MTISLAPEKEQKVQELAAARGQNVADYLHQLIEKDLQEANEHSLPPSPADMKTFDEIVAPFEKAVEQSGLTGEELDAVFRQAREEVWQEKQGKTGKPS